MDDGADAANDTGFRGDLAKKFAFTSRVVQPTPPSMVVTNASPIAESIRVIASPACTIPIGL